MLENYIILVNKEMGVSSAKVVAKLKKKFNLKKIGHAGTLDQEATGLLICLVNKATRLNSLLLTGKKTYSGVIKLGTETETDDIFGEVIKECTNIPDFDLVSKAVKKFTGKISQTPPNYSAVKVDGKRAYKIALNGEKPKIKSKEVTIYDFSVLQIDENRISYSITCSSGTYIRALARDLGKELGCGGCTESINRDFSNPFSLKFAKSIEEITEADFICWSKALPDFETVELGEDLISLLKLGNQNVYNRDDFPLANKYSNKNLIYKSIEDNKPLGILYSDGENWKITNNFC